MSSALPAAPPPPGGSTALTPPAPPGGPTEHLGEAPAPPTPSVPGGRLAPLTRAFRAKRQQQQRALARTPATVTVVQSEPAEARQERARQIAQLRAFMQEGARGVALQNIPTTPRSAQPDQQQGAIADVIAGVRARQASHNPQTIRERARTLAERRAAPKTVPLKQLIDPTGRLYTDEDLEARPRNYAAPQAAISPEEQAEIDRKNAAYEAERQRLRDEGERRLGHA